MREILLIGLGGFFGAILRYFVSGIIPVKFGIPTGTLIVNLLGSFILGFIVYSSLFGSLSPEYRLLIITGFCGALTTFSTFSYESFVMLEYNHYLEVGLNIILNVFGCLVMIYFGRLASMFFW
ncbi:fluoride efflux transporter CrcB [Methanococcus maripaludis]|uniref:Fluoride-specific ion channel FluC n=2 Tax=Methanococcus maripaludis TaxID=39152 RepID=A0A7J9PEN7_METMI|nr:fluoride efflux transporter CrcB [Methanococcus maripaludis]MBA2861244.1 CrcB protein [Methanococcus maripaludis]